VIAAIVIAIVVFIVLSVIGAKKGYDYWKGKQTKMTGVQTNPLYTENMKGGENPMFVSATTLKDPIILPYVFLFTVSK